MQPAQTSSYDEVPYVTRPRFATHPDTLATVATLLGMRPAPVERCRVLELGCASGGNLLPLADALPDSEFVGIDLSSRQIDEGREVVAALGMKNLRLETRGILDVGEAMGKFDYVLCHGVYSWVGEAVRDGILRACKGVLNPSGVAYVSYNTYPGWYRRAAVHDLLNFHVQGIASARERAAEARAFLGFFQEALGDSDDTWPRMVREECETLLAEGDYYLLHEHLDAENHPVYFHQFIDHSRRFGLQFLGEAASHLTLAPYPPQVQKTLQRVSPDLLALEQYSDFLKCRSFRCTLLVHSDVALERSPKPEILDRFLLAGLARPENTTTRMLEINVCTPEVVAFRNEDDGTVETNQPLTKAALVLLFEAWPQAMRFDELWRRARQRLAAGGVVVAEDGRAGLAGALVELYLAKLVGLHTYVPPFVTDVSDRPATTALIRAQARTGAPVYNRRNRQVDLGGLDRVVLGMLDGDRDRPALLEGLVARVVEDKVELRKDDRPVSDPIAVRGLLAGELEESLRRLAERALLVS